MIGLMSVNLINATNYQMSIYLSMMPKNTVPQFAKADTALYPFWIGLQAQVNVFGDTYYSWVDGRLANYTPWAVNEPSIKSGCYAVKTLSTDNGYKSVDCKYDQPFICKQHSANCQSKLHDGFNGTIESPNYPDNYDNNLDCFYHITVPEGYVIVLTVMDFDTEATDTLFIWDGPDNSNGTHLIHELDGFNVPIGAKFESTSNEVTLHFSSDYANVYRGWQFSYQAVIDNAITWYNTTEGVITSPNYPDVYPNFYIEISKVVVAENLRIKFYVEKFTTEPNNDYLAIYNGDQIDVVNNTIATLSGHLDDNWPDPSPLPLTYYSTSNIATLLFYTDRTVNAVGFKLLYEGVSIE
uniref:CUB domain-containing protein n=1 Tax=Panagrellus redivivus TaxID=6233 RepID=A0A7E4ZUY1_PANRE